MYIRTLSLISCCALMLNFGLHPLSAQTPTASPTPDDSAPTASASTQALLAVAQADVDAGCYADALARLQVKPDASADDMRLLQFATANVQFAWARSLFDHARHPTFRRPSQ